MNTDLGTQEFYPTYKQKIFPKVQPDCEIFHTFRENNFLKTVIFWSPWHLQVCVSVQEDLLLQTLKAHSAEQTLENLAEVLGCVTTRVSQS